MKYDEQLLNNADIGDRVYCKTVDNQIVKILKIDDFYLAICNLLTRALDGLV